jgi:hypothetical protein
MRSSFQSLWMRPTAVVRLALALLASLAGGCKQSTKGVSGDVQRRAQGVGVLPARDFFQYEPTFGTTDLTQISITGTGETDGTVITTGDGSGRVRIGVREESGATNYLTATAGFHLGLLTGRTDSYRIVCSSEFFGTYVAPGPRGNVFLYNKSQGTRLTCWTSLPSTGDWHSLVVAAPTPNRAHWLLFLSGEDNSADVVYGTEERFDSSMYHVGRSVDDKAYIQTLDVENGVASLGNRDEDNYPSLSENVARDMVDVPCDGLCGYVWTGADWKSCGGCPDGLTCQEQECKEGSCTPKTAAEVCLPREGDPPFGQRYDECSDLVDCPPCPDGMAGGANGDLLACSRYPAPMSPQALRASYQDVLNQLCGVVGDPASSSNIDLGTQCPRLYQYCNTAANLCQPVEYPAPLTDEEDNTYATDGGESCTGCWDVGE